MDTLRLLGFLTLCSCALAEIRIKELQVPAQLQHGKFNSIVLDCKYEVDTPEDKIGLVIQWFFQENNLVYQWFPEKEPQVRGILTNRLDLNYSVSSDKDHKHRALKIINITTELTGNYKCKVANYGDETSQSQMMVVYEPPKEFRFDSFENTSVLLCSVYDIFPKPTLTVYSNGVNLTEISDEDYSENDNEDDDIYDNEVDRDVQEVEEAYGVYNVTKSFRYEPADITEEIEFICELKIPNTNYRQVLRRVITPEGETTSTTETYDYETTTTMTTTNSPVIPGNLALTSRSSNTLLSIIAFVYIWRHL